MAALDRDGWLSLGGIAAQLSAFVAERGPPGKDESFARTVSSHETELAELRKLVADGFERLGEKVDACAAAVAQTVAERPAPRVRQSGFFGHSHIPAASKGTGLWANPQGQGRGGHTSGDFGSGVLPPAARRRSQRQQPSPLKEVPRSTSLATDNVQSPLHLSPGPTSTAYRGSGASESLRQSPPTFPQPAPQLPPVRVDDVVAVEDEERRPPLLLPDSWTVTIVEAAYLVSVCFDAATVTGAAVTNNWHTAPGVPLLVLHALCTVVCAVHMVMQPRVAIFVGWQLVDDNKDFVRERYMRSWFVFDALFTVPFDLLCLPFSVLMYRVLQTLRTCRIVRLRNLFRTSDPLEPQRYQVMLSFAGVVITHHFIACVHNCARYSCDGGPRDAMDEYVESLLWAVQTTTSVGYGDVLDDRTGMRWLAIVTMFMGSGLYGWVIGQISAYLASQDHLQKKREEHRAMLKSLMHRYEVPFSIQKEAFNIYPLIFGTGAHNFTDALELLPPFLQNKIHRHMTFKLLKGVPMFAGAESFILRLLGQRLTRHVIEPDCSLIDIGETGKEMYFLSTGAVEVLVPDAETKALRQVVILRDGSWFGEIAILKETRRTAAIRTITACDLFMLTKEDFWDLLTQHPGSRFETAILEEVERRLKVTESRNPNGPPPVGGAAVSTRHSSINIPPRELSATAAGGELTRSPSLIIASPTFKKSKQRQHGCALLQDATVDLDVFGPEDSDLNDLVSNVRESSFASRRSETNPHTPTAGEGTQQTASPRQTFRRALAVARMRQVLASAQEQASGFSLLPSVGGDDDTSRTSSASVLRPKGGVSLRLRLRAEAERSRAYALDQDQDLQPEGQIVVTTPPVFNIAGARNAPTSPLDTGYGVAYPEIQPESVQAASPEVLPQHPLAPLQMPAD